jgi:hypothetical protein
MLDVAHADHDPAARPVPTRIELAQVGIGKPDGRLECAGNLPAHAVLAVQRAEEQVHRHRVRVLLSGANLLGDHFLLLGELLGPERGSAHGFGHQLGDRPELVTGKPAVEAGRFLVGERIQLGPVRLRRDVDGNDVLGGRAAEDHVLNHVRDAALARRVVATAGQEANAQRHRPDVRQPLGNHDQAGRQCRRPDTVSHAVTLQHRRVLGTKSEGRSANGQCPTGHSTLIGHWQLGLGHFLCIVLHPCDFVLS